MQLCPLPAPPPAPLLRRAGASLAVAAATLALACSLAGAGPYIWDQDGDGIDDRMETVNLLGYRYSFVGADTLQQQRIEVAPGPTGLLYGIYVVYDHEPTAADLFALNGLGITVHAHLLAVPAVHGTATFAQASLARGLPGVQRIEAVPDLYPVVRDGTAAIGIRDASLNVFPTWETASVGAPPAGGPNVAGSPAARGEGQIIAILDTGVNDAPDGNYPGHESLIGRALGGADFTQGDSLLDTPRSGSVNPTDHGQAVNHAHGTYTAGIALGSGGASGFAVGVAPAAKFVDVRVLNDAGRGTEVPEGIDWCIANRSRDWGDPDASYRGIDVINLSLSSPDSSDGTDVASRIAARAVQLGIVVVASMGNDGLTGFVPSPAAGDGVIAVGAWDTQRTGAPDDDQPAPFSNTGPRAGGPAPNPLDGLKPTLLAPGVAVLSADGDPTSDGAQYRRASGTSAATAFVSGVAALLRSHRPDLEPASLRDLLVRTARRNLPRLPAGTGGADPRWNSARGYGLVDVYAAGLDAADPGHTQVRRLAAAAGPTGIAFTVWTQRERGAAHLVLERAPDLSGAPGSFAPFDSVATAGDSSLAGASNLTAYALAVPAAQAPAGTTAWYRIAYTEGGVRYSGPARPVTAYAGPPAATIEVTVVHNAYDHDVDAAIEAYGAIQGPVTTLTYPLPGSSAAVATDWVDGLSSSGNVALTFRVDVPHGAIDALLPPSASTPWNLRALEGGYPNDSGRITEFKVTWHGPSGDVDFDASGVPAPTIEGQTTNVRIPAATTDVEPIAPAPGFRTFPNPVVSGAEVTLVVTRGRASRATLFDLAGREVGRVALEPDGAGGAVGRWRARTAGGGAIAPGIYFLRVAGQATRRLVVVAR
jgi:hypothetical protein